MVSHAWWLGGDNWEAGLTGAHSLSMCSLQHGTQTSHMVAQGSKSQEAELEAAFESLD